MARATDLDGIAIIGMSCRFPGAPDVDRFWANLRDGVESIGFFSESELAAAGVPAAVLRSPGFVKASPYLDGVEQFDAAFFGFTPREAELMDPQHRLFLECAWEALETAGYDSERSRSRIGVFAGAGLNTYAACKIYPAREVRMGVDPIQLMVAIDKDFLPTMTSYKMNLRGPSVGVQTACSTGLVAVNLACQSLLTYGCDLALAGGASIEFPHGAGYYFQPGGVLSPDGHCRAFDADATGTVHGSGVGVVVLKRLEDALADGDTIDAVIRGSAINNDGARKLGYTAPSVQGQTEVIALALALAGVEADDIGLIEAHGFATSLGDPMEFTALCEAFGATRKRQFCALGSAKPNIGHLEAAAGIAGLVKTVLALKHRQIPPLLHFQKPNPRIDLAASPFYVNTALTSWESAGSPRRAGVSSFGIGGTNAHVILEEAPEPEPLERTYSWQVLLLSARSEGALDAMASRLAAHLERSPGLELGDLAFTLQVGRREFEHRSALLCRDREVALAALRAGGGARALATAGRTGERPVTFLLPGRGTGRPGLVRALYAGEAVFRQEIDRCGRILLPVLGSDLRAALSAPESEGAELPLPALFSWEYALAKLWMAWGIQPESMLGQGIGEYVAACLAGALSLEGALFLTAALDRMARQMGNTSSRPAKRHLEGLTAELRKAGVRKPQIPLWTSVTGALLSTAGPPDPALWARAPWEQERAVDALGELLQDPGRVLLEIVDGGLADGAQAHSARWPGQAIVRSCERTPDQPEEVALLAALGRLWLAGVSVDWKGFHAGTRHRRVPLPTYPFERQLYTLPDVAWESAAEAVAPAALHGRPDLSNPYVALRNGIERKIAGIWGELFGYTLIGAEDDFFELGGQSLLAIQLAARLRSTFDLPLSLDSILKAPTVAGLSHLVLEKLAGLLQVEGDRVADLSAAEIRSLVGKASQEAEGPVVPVLRPAPEERHQPFPLTDLQQAYWIGRSGLFELGNVSSYSYNEWVLIDLDVDRLALTVQRLIDRHEMLRAVVLPDGRQQVLTQLPPYEIRILDLRHEREEDAALAVATLRKEMSDQILPTDRWPLFELRIALLDEHRSSVHFGFDILIGDLWSLRVLMRELQQLYTDSDAVLEAIGMSFRDYVLAQKEFETSRESRRAEDYWRSRLATLPAAPELPLVQSLASSRSPSFVRRSSQLEPEAWQGLRAMASKHGLTPSALLLTAYGAILALWSKSLRFTVNVTTFNRLPVHPDIYRVVGDFTSSTLVSLDFAADGTFAERARTAHEQLWSSLQHSHISAVRLMRDLGRGQGRGAPTLMPVVFTSVLLGGEQSMQDEDATPKPGSLNPKSSAFGVSQTPQVFLDHQVSEHRGRLVFNWDAIEDLFPEGMLDVMFRAYCKLLEGLTREEAWEQTSQTWLLRPGLVARQAINATEAPVPTSLLHAAFEARAKEAPERVAVVSGAKVLTYGELDRWSDRLARRLYQAGARPNRPVAVVMAKGWEQVVAVIGILKAGAPYLPIDPELPRERRWLLLSQGEVELAVTQPWLDGALEWPEGIERFRVEDGGMEAGEGTGSALDVVQSPDDLAYVIFTSGSTGRPKGVMIDHRGALNTVVDVNQRFAVGEGDRLLALSSLSFDLSVYDIFGLLATGGALVMPEPEARRDPARWLELIEEHRVTLWNSVPALLEMLVRSTEIEPAAGRGMSSLRLVLLSGDWIPVRLPDRLRSLSPDAVVISMGGATEASIWSILYPIGEVPPAWTSIPYGRPMVNQQFHVLDQRLEPRPTWVPGDLHIGGIGLAKGYWGDPEKTSASFIVHPRTGEPLYRTGDLGRYLPSGDIEFLGREDFQVKIRGHRVELGEIEKVLEEHPAVRTAVAVVLGEECINLRLIAYVLPKLPLAAAGPSDARSADLKAARRGIVDHGFEGVDFALSEPGLRRDPALGAEVAFPAPRLDEATLRPYRSRSSRREFRSSPVGAEQMSRLLGVLLPGRFQGLNQPAYRYLVDDRSSVSVYLYFRSGRVEGLAGGFYRFEPRTHALRPLALDAELDRSAHVSINQSAFDQCAFMLFLAGAEVDAAPGARERELLEAGSIGQLLMESAPGAGLGLCPVGFMDDEQVAPWLGVTTEKLLHGFIGGTIVDAVEAPSYEARGEAALPRGEVRLGRPSLESGLDAYRPRHVPGEPPRSVPLGRLAGILEALRGIQADEWAFPKYRFPSAGGLYPVQTYIHVRSGWVAGLPGGVYYYHPRKHALFTLASGIPDPEGGDLSSRAAFTVLLVGALDVMEPKYGELSRDFCLLEAGYLGQLLKHAAGEQGYGLAPVRALDVDRAASLLALDGRHRLLGAWSGVRVGGETTPAVCDPWLDEEPAVADPVIVHGEPAPAKSDPQDLAAELTRHAEGKLPSYMVPGAFVFLDSLPLTPNGKVDRKALPHPQLEDRSESAFEAPGTPLEIELCEIWSDLLGRQRIGAHDHFFALGGDSIQAVQFLARAREAGIELTFREFFEHQTIAKLATLARVTRPLPGAGAASRDPVASPGESPAFPAGLTEQELADLAEEFGEEDLDVQV